MSEMGPNTPEEMSLRSKIDKLAQAKEPDAQLTQDPGNRVLYADSAYATLHAAGVIDEPFVFPSVRLARENHDAHKRYPVISNSTDSPTIALEGHTQYPAVVLEQEDRIDDDLTEEYSYSVTRWIGFLSMDTARKYVDEYGAHVEIPGAGEFTGTFYSREALANPHYKPHASEHES